jgi:hypothetical protein
MSEIEDRLNSILSDPQMMSKIQAMAQSMNQSQESGESPVGNFPDIDIGMLTRLSGFANNARVDNDQQNLLRALSPYLTRERIGKLERAMRAAKMAKMASGFLASQPLSL